MLSCTSHPAQLMQVAKFGVLGVDRVIHQLDEAVGLGVILNVSPAEPAALYLTTGQDVPEDMEVGHRRRWLNDLNRAEIASQPRNTWRERRLQQQAAGPDRQSACTGRAVPAVGR